jgi:hypothetical protein
MCARMHVVSAKISCPLPRSCLALPYPPAWRNGCAGAAPVQRARPRLRRRLAAAVASQHFRDKNRRYMGKSQSKRPSKRTSSHRTAAPPDRGGVAPPERRGVPPHVHLVLRGTWHRTDHASQQGAYLRHVPER